MREDNLNSQTLKRELWQTLQDLRRHKIDPTVANAIACQSREIMRVVRTEMAIMAASNEKPTQKLIG